LKIIHLLPLLFRFIYLIGAVSNHYKLPTKIMLGIIVVYQIYFYCFSQKQTLISGGNYFLLKQNTMIKVNKLTNGSKASGAHQTKSNHLPEAITKP